MKSQLLNAFFIVLGYSILTTEACGPGRAGGRRRMLRKYPPLVQRQYIPNVSENNMGASGKPEGPITRNTCRFNELVENWNPDIEFRDDEKTGADRMMSQRLKEKLSTLAISVMNQWPNVRLRVIEGWDEDYKHSVDSLHYEGRAVDITTNDRDQKKYGMLARLAVEAGFDWVHYESRSHVHCSVKSEKADTIRNHGCFDSSGLVETPDGEMEMSQLQTNDMVLTMNSRGQLQFSPIIMWLDRDEAGQELFVELKTKSNRVIRLTSSHLIYVADEPFDLTQIDQESPKLMRLNNYQSPGTGYGDNNQNNYFYYETQQGPTNSSASKNNTKPADDGGSASCDNSGRTNVPSSNDVNELPNSDLSYSQQSPQPEPFVLTIDDIAFPTYARNAIVGQYLLSHLPTGPFQVPPTKMEANYYETDDKGSESSKFDKYARDRPKNRLVFFYQDNNGVVGSQDDVQRARPSRPPTIKFDQIVSVNYVTRRGIHAPLTREGNIVVNSVVASCYAVISDHELAHMSFAPVRWFSYLHQWLFGLKSRSPLSHRTVEAIRRQDDSLKAQDTHNKHIISDSPVTTPLSKTTRNRPTPKREIHWYPMILYRIAKFILPTRYLY